jgi:maleylacetoacetate isomerase/maleylpyruvate isomerase
LNNLRVLKYLSQQLALDEDSKNTWYRHWVRLGLLAFEQQLSHSPAGRYCHGDTPGLADCLLVPQIFNGQRFQVDFSGMDRTMAVFDACMQLPAFQQAQPSACPDAQS